MAFWLISLRIISLRLILVAACISTSFLSSFFLPKIFHCINISHFIYSFFIWWTFGCFHFWLLWIKLLWMFVYKFSCGCMFSFLSGISLVVESLGHMVLQCLTFEELLACCPKRLHHFYIPTAYEVPMHCSNISSV